MPLDEATQAMRRRAIHDIHDALRIQPRVDERDLEYDRPKAPRDSASAAMARTPKQKLKSAKPVFGGPNPFQAAKGSKRV